MCTLVFAWQVFDETPIAAAANRDEALGRPSRPPGVLDESPRVVAPRDEEAGGTWIGYNDAGVFVAITNRRRESSEDRDNHGENRDDRSEDTDGSGFDADRSRGLLVRDALRERSARDALALVRNELAAREYDGFNLVVADADDATLLEWDGVLRATHFDPGVHVVVNDGYDDAAPKAVRIREAISPDPETGDSDDDAWFDRAKSVLRDHDLGACVHGDGYGTRSSSLVAIDATGRGRYWFADGPPCETEYEAVATGDGHI
ncbi:NRDE family protein [Halorussus amylolyticus]|uniref:NRDE family protein n=1 Tax=Halorussus amylolyticus TaxID=1126242 RepID=UPI00104A4090|nr:NRDE family protein [Halorussus amylolyticus]